MVTELGVWDTLPLTVSYAGCLSLNVLTISFEVAGSKWVRFMKSCIHIDPLSQLLLCTHFIYHSLSFNGFP